jgi:hypothetical protein
MSNGRHSYMASSDFHKPGESQAKQSTLHQSSSQLMTKQPSPTEYSHVGKHSYIVQTSNDIGRPSLSCKASGKNSQFFKSEGYRTSAQFGADCKKIEEVPSIKSGSSQLPSSGLPKQQPKVSLHPPSAKKEPILKKVSTTKNNMHVSIMNGIPDEEIKHSKCRTQYMHADSVSSISHSNNTFSRPWITTKTLTKLISDHENSASLQSSIQESSEYYNCS